MVHKAHEMGLDQGPKFQELMKVARIGVLTKELSQSLQDEAGKISDKEIETYYHNNEAAFQESNCNGSSYRAASRPRTAKTNRAPTTRPRKSSRNPKTP